MHIPSFFVLLGLTQTILVGMYFWPSLSYPCFYEMIWFSPTHYLILWANIEFYRLAADSSAWECEICEDAVDFGLAALKNNSTEAVVSEQVNSACSKIASNATSECEKIAGTILAKGLELIEDNVQPSAVCSYLGYC